MRVFVVVLVFSFFVVILGMRKYTNFKAQQKAQMVFDSIKSYSDKQRKNIKVQEIGSPLHSKGNLP